MINVFYIERSENKLQGTCLKKLSVICKLPTYFKANIFFRKINQCFLEKLLKKIKQLFKLVS